MEMVAHECAVDQYIDLMKTSRLDENTSTENLEKVINFLQVCLLKLIWNRYHAAPSGRFKICRSIIIFQKDTWIHFF